MSNPEALPPIILLATYKRELATNMGTAHICYTYDPKTQKTLETVTLPSISRCKLALGLDNPQAHAHHKYRQYCKNQPYLLVWFDKENTPDEAKFVAELEELIYKKSKTDVSGT